MEFLSADAPRNPTIGAVRQQVSITKIISVWIKVYQHQFSSYESGSLAQPKTISGWIKWNVDRNFRDMAASRPIVMVQSMDVYSVQ